MIVLHENGWPKLRILHILNYDEHGVIKRVYIDFGQTCNKHFEHL